MKAIREDRRPSAEARARFLREARVLSQLDHPRICRVYDYVAGDEVDFIVMELVEGRSLRAALAAGLPRSRRPAVAEQLAEVLVTAHAAGIVHRDLKPDNVMLDLSGEVNVLDFGLARIAGPPIVASSAPSGSTAEAATGADMAVADLAEAETLGSPSGPPASAGALGAPVTAVGAITGTLAYMSPEQARGEPATTASDMYSLGIMLQELFTGSRAYPPGITAAELLKRARRAETQPVTGVGRDLAALLERLKSPPLPSPSWGCSSTRSTCGGNAPSPWPRNKRPSTAGARPRSSSSSCSATCARGSSRWAGSTLSTGRRRPSTTSPP
jgi:serine/threonine protein kinase